MRRRTRVAVLAAALATMVLAGCRVNADFEPRGQETVTPSPNGSVATTPSPPTGTELSASRSASTAPTTELPAPPDGGLADRAEKDARAPKPIIPETPMIGADISWPNCPKGMGIKERRTQGLPMPGPETRYVVIGITNGPAFTTNPCFEDQLAWARERRLLTSAYSVLSYPDKAQLKRYGGKGPYSPESTAGRLKNVGYQEAQHTFRVLRRAGLDTPAVWLDVEPVSVWEWSSDLAANAAVVEGAARAYEDAGFRIGVYSLDTMWAEIVGSFSLGVPEWRPAGESSRKQALDRCGGHWSFQGGDAILTQVVDGDRDINLTCPGARIDPWFVQY